jgi:hypothetical protein
VKSFRIFGSLLFYRQFGRDLLLGSLNSPHPRPLPEPERFSRKDRPLLCFLLPASQPGGLVEGSRWSFLLLEDDHRSKFRDTQSIPEGCQNTSLFHLHGSLASLRDAVFFQPYPVVVFSGASKRPPATLLHPSRMQFTLPDDRANLIPNYAR